MGCFQSRLPAPLTSKDIHLLTLKCNLTREELHQWHDSFVHCYPHGYLSKKKFVLYFQQLRDEYSLQLRPFIEQLFDVFDLDNDKKLDFSEFVLLSVLSNDGSINEKMQLIFRFYQHDKDKCLSREEIKEFLRHMFDVFDIPSSKSNITDVIDRVFQRNDLNREQKIKWDQFTQDVLNDQTLFRQLVSLDTRTNDQLIQRSERF